MSRPIRLFSGVCLTGRDVFTRLGLLRMNYLLGAGGDWVGAGMVAAGAPDGAGALPPQEPQPELQVEHPLPQVCE